MACELLAAPRASGRGGRGRSSRGSGCRAGSRCGRTARRSPCSGAPARARGPRRAVPLTSRQSPQALGRPGGTARRGAASARNPRGSVMPSPPPPRAPRSAATRRRSCGSTCDERRRRGRPGRASSARGDGAAGELAVALEQRAQRVRDPRRRRSATDVVVDQVGAQRRRAAGTRSRPTCRPRSCARSRPSTTHDAAGHVLAAVVADALDDGRRARVAHAEALAREAAEERLAGGRAVQRDVAADDVAPRPRSRVGRRARRSAGRPRGPCRSSRCTDAVSSSVMPRTANAPKLWPPVPSSRSVTRAVGQARAAAQISPREHRADASGRCCAPRRSISTASPRSAAPTATSQRWSAATSRPWSCALGAGARRPARRAGAAAAPDRGPSATATGRRLAAQQVGAADEIVEPPHADRRHQLAHALGDEQQVADDVLGRAR